MRDVQTTQQALVFLKEKVKSKSMKHVLQTPNQTWPLQGMRMPKRRFGRCLRLRINELYFLRSLETELSGRASNRCSVPRRFLFCDRKTQGF